MAHADGEIDLGVLAELGPARFDEVLDALGSPQLRDTLYYLAAKPAVTLGELAAVLTGYDAARSGGIGTPADRDRFRTLLYHKTLPRLEALEFVELSQDKRVVVDTTVPQPVYDALDVDPPDR